VAAQITPVRKVDTAASATVGEAYKMHWLTADPHYAHRDVIHICDRPFANVATMNSHLLAECRSPAPLSARPRG
jgi:hypothetical protein